METNGAGLERPVAGLDNPPVRVNGNRTALSGGSPGRTLNRLPAKVSKMIGSLCQRLSVDCVQFTDRITEHVQSLAVHMLALAGHKSKAEKITKASTAEKLVLGAVGLDLEVICGFGHTAEVYGILHRAVPQAPAPRTFRCHVLVVKAYGQWLTGLEITIARLRRQPELRAKLSPAAVKEAAADCKSIAQFCRKHNIDTAILGQERKAAVNGASSPVLAPGKVASGTELERYLAQFTPGINLMNPDQLRQAEDRLRSTLELIRTTRKAKSLHTVESSGAGNAGPSVSKQKSAEYSKENLEQLSFGFVSQKPKGPKSRRSTRLGGKQGTGNQGAP